MSWRNWPRCRSATRPCGTSHAASRTAATTDPAASAATPFTKSEIASPTGFVAPPPVRRRAHADAAATAVPRPMPASVTTSTPHGRTYRGDTTRDGTTSTAHPTATAGTIHHPGHRRAGRVAVATTSSSASPSTTGPSAASSPE